MRVSKSWKKMTLFFCMCVWWNKSWLAQNEERQIESFAYRMWLAAGTDTIVSKIWTKNLGQTVVLIYVPLFVTLLICISANYSKYLCKKRSVFFVNEKSLGERVAPTYVPLIVSLIWEAGLAQDRCLLVPSLTTFFIVTHFHCHSIRGALLDSHADHVSDILDDQIWWQSCWT